MSEIKEIYLRVDYAGFPFPHKGSDKLNIFDYDFIFQLVKEIKQNEPLKFIKAPDWREIAKDGLPKEEGVYECDHIDYEFPQLLKFFDDGFFVDNYRNRLNPTHYRKWDLPRAV